MWRQHIIAIQIGYAHVGKERLLVKKITMKILGDEFPSSPKFLCSCLKLILKLKFLRNFR